MKKILNDKFKNIFIIILLPILMYGILGPLEIYSGNVDEFGLTLGDFFWGFLFGSIILLILGTLVISLLPEKIRNGISYFIFLFSIASYIQGMFLNTKLTMSDGSDMDWSLFKTTFITNSIVWVVIFIIGIVIFIFKSEITIKVAKYISLFISGILSITIITLLITTPRLNNNEMQLDVTNQFQLAKGENIIVLVLDRYGNEQFEKIAGQFPEIKDCLKDFTYYNNANSDYSNTYPSMNHLLTGQMMDYDMDDDEWRTMIWKEPSTIEFYKTLHEKKFTVHLYSPFASAVYGNIGNMSGMIDNIKPAVINKNYKLIYALLEKATIYRYAPYIFKPRFEVKSNVFNQMVITEEPEYNNSGFYRSLKELGLSIDDSMENLLIVDHILGMHNPFEIDENANQIPEGKNDDETIDKVTRGLHVILAEYMNQLKKLGLYDNATIIITADHGDYYSGGGMQPIYFIKTANETHDEMIVNSAPISHKDFIPTVLAVMNEDYASYGTSIFDWHEGDRRERMIDCHLDSKYYTDRYELYKVSEENHIEY